MKKIILVAITCILVINAEVFANENFRNIDRVLNIAFQHARNYPPQFDAKVQREMLEVELRHAIANLETMAKSSNSNPQILLRLGIASTFAYNLDMPGSKEKADYSFMHLFRIEPDNAKGHLYYGQHLSGRGEFHNGIEHLKVAADGGLDHALIMIGLAYMQLGKNDEARLYFQRFKKIHPDDPQVKLLLKMLDPSSPYTYKLKKK